MEESWELEGTRLKTARRRRGMTHRQLAERLGIKERTVKAWEEKTEWCEDKETILKLAEVLKFLPRFFTGPEIENLESKDIHW